MSLFYNNMLRWLEGHQIRCVFKSITAIDCPGCGLQRSLVELLRGNVVASIQFHPATIPLLWLMLFTGLQVFFHFKKGASVIIYSTIFIAVLMLVKFFLQFTW